MDESRMYSLIAMIALVPIYALLTVSVTALINSRAEYADENQELGNRRLKLTQQLLATLILLALALTAYAALIAPLQTLWQNTWLPFIVVLVPLAVIALVFGEIAPASVGATHADWFAPVARLLMRLPLLLLRPLTWLVYRLSVLAAGMFGGKEVSNSITEEELLTLLDAGQSFEEDERKMIHSVLELDETAVTEIMVPRIDIIAVEKSTSIAEARQVFLESGHSRLPVYDDNIDHVVGLCYVKDLLEVWHNGNTVVESVEEIMRPAHFVPETMTADQLLREFKLNKVHLIIVVEEYGGTGGLVTLENLLEEIVGDIQDEYDGDEIDDIVQVGNNEYRVDAGVILDDLNDALGVELSDEDVDTLGGFIFNMLERVPERGEMIELETLALRVDKVEGRRIREVFVTKRMLEPKDDTEADAQPDADTDEDAVEIAEKSENIA